MNEIVLEMKDIYKSFGGVKALRGVKLTCRKGEVHILAGENGAGKSTILKILSGLYKQDKGEIWFKGEKQSFSSPQQALKKGIAMVFQELTLIPEMTILENVFLNIESTTKAGAINKKEMYNKLGSVMERYGIVLNMDAYVKTLTVAEQQMAEILKILVRDPDLIVLDEPTSALANEEVAKLFEIVKTLQENDKTIIFISHRMEEMFEIGSRITVFKDGEYVNSKPIEETNMDDLFV